MRAALLAALLLTAAPAQDARSEAGRSAANTLTVPLGSRATAMGDSYVAVDGSVDSLGYNPAGLSRIKRPVLETTYTHGIIDDHFSFTGYAHPMSFGVLSAGALYYDAGTINLNLSNGTTGRRKAQQDMVGLLNASVPLPMGFSAGATGKFYRFELAEEAKASGAAIDLGVLWHSPVKGLNLGAAIQNMGPDVKFEQEGDPLPMTERFGAAYLLDFEKAGGSNDPTRTGFTKFLFTADGIKPRDGQLYAGLGLELDMPLGGATQAALRFGYLFNRDIDSVTAGIGFREKRFVFDYALGVKRAISNVHSFSVGVQF